MNPEGFAYMHWALFTYPVSVQSSVQGRSGWTPTLHHMWREGVR